MRSTLCQAAKEDLVDGVEEGQPKKAFSQNGIEVYVKIVLKKMIILYIDDYIRIYSYNYIVQL